MPHSEHVEWNSFTFRLRRVGRSETRSSSSRRCEPLMPTPQKKINLVSEKICTGSSAWPPESNGVAHR
ncbi:hypothetical protein CDAR_454341 [Caerostris darwini]|uniref:Uncharacterized protein n=1 Tax=Caerostris darwini TaxID=1538125 RepID=A0AAV4V7Y6_9ARAC|nr:hypothetical protein CDAR_454341 [Caerostris darwini]